MRDKISMSAAALLALCIGFNVVSQALSSSADVHFHGAASASLPLVAKSRPVARNLQTKRVDVAQYLIPTRQSTLCSGGNCCNSDYRASPFSLQHVNSSLTTVGQIQMTTFYFKLRSDQQRCTGDCCSSNIQKIWIDVDPKLQVEYASIAGQTSNIQAQQDEYGFHIVPGAGLLSTIPADGTLVTVTVQGAVPNLCPVPDYMLGVPINGTCQTILLGATPEGASCCPFGLSRPMASTPTYTPAPLPCVDALSSSPFQLQLLRVSDVFSDAAGASLANFSFSLLSDSPSCVPAAINTCCGMAIDTLTLPLQPGVSVRSTSVGGQLVSGSAINSGGLQLTALGLSDSSIPPGGLSIVLTVQLPAGASHVPDICLPDPSAPGKVGHCAYSLTAAPGSSMCCPAASTVALAPGSVAPSPPPGTCAPSQTVDLSETSMGFNYYNGPLPASAGTTEFTFTVFNSPVACTKPYCEDVCSWSLSINPAFAQLLSFSSDAPGNSAGALLDTASSSVTFSVPPPHAGTLLYTVVVAAAGVTLEQLCGGPSAANPQRPCLATVRNPVVQSTVQFGQGDILVNRSPQPTPSPSTPPACLNGSPLADSCVRVDNATYNTPSASHTLLAFAVVNHDGAGGCTRDDSVMTFQVLLVKQVVNELRASNAIVPTTAVFANDSSSLTWSWTPVAAGSSLHYQLDASGGLSPATMCAQGVRPDQPPGSCAVAFSGSSGCYFGFVPVAFDPSLQETTSPISRSSGIAAIVAPAVVVPLVVLVVVLALLLLLAHRRRKQRQEREQGAGGAGSDDLASPLAPRDGSASVDSRQTSASGVSHRSAEDVLIRLPDSAAGQGAAAGAH